MLLGKRANPDARDKRFQTPLMLACLAGALDHATLLIACGAEPDLRDENERTALMMAAVRRRTGLVRRLLSAGAKTGLQADDGSTALMLAGNKEILPLLLEAGADVSLRDRKGRSVRE